MKRNFWNVLFAAVTLFAVAAPVLAHHSFDAEYDRTKSMTFSGKVTKMEWTNPHIWYYVDVKATDGKIVTYAVEGDAPNALFRRGWRRDSLKPGDNVTVTGYIAKNGSNHINANKVTFADGTAIVGLGSSGNSAPGSDR